MQDVTTQVRPGARETLRLSSICQQVMHSPRERCCVTSVPWCKGSPLWAWKIPHFTCGNSSNHEENVKNRGRRGVREGKYLYTLHWGIRSQLKLFTLETRTFQDSPIAGGLRSPSNSKFPTSNGQVSAWARRSALQPTTSTCSLHL